MRVALIHALAHSVAPVNAEFDRVWPDCERMNLLDDSLSTDLARSETGLDERMTARLVALAGYAIDAGAQGILFSCSAFGPCIDVVAQRWPDIPVLKPNEAMVADAARRVVDQGAEVIALAQFSIARAAPAVERAVSVPVITTVGSAVRALRARMLKQPANTTNVHR